MLLNRQNFCFCIALMLFLLRTYLYLYNLLCKKLFKFCNILIHNKALICCFNYFFLFWNFFKNFIKTYNRLKSVSAVFCQSSAHHEQFLLRITTAYSGPFFMDSAFICIFIKIHTFKDQTRLVFIYYFQICIKRMQLLQFFKFLFRLNNVFVFNINFPAAPSASITMTDSVILTP